MRHIFNAKVTVHENSERGVVDALKRFKRACGNAKIRRVQYFLKPGDRKRLKSKKVREKLAKLARKNAANDVDPANWTDRKTWMDNAA